MGIGLCFGTTTAAAQTTKKELAIAFDSPIIIRQGDVDVSLADFVAFLDWRVPREDQRGVLASPARIEQLLETIVLTEAFMNRMQATEALDDPFVQARIYQAAAREARSIYRNRIREEQELDSYEQQARELYLVDRDRFSRRETIDFDHILIAVNDEQDEITAMRRAADAYEALMADRSFDEVAAEFSDDPGFEEHKGRFTDIEIDSLVPSVAQAADTLQLQEFSIPIQSRFGWHIIRITSVNEAGQMSWEEAKPMAERIARDRHLSEAYERVLREINSAPLQFADEGVRTILDHYGIDGFDMEIPNDEDSDESDTE
jgi:parvulin-like peptidyl-prolyl isomerase